MKRQEVRVAEWELKNNNEQRTKWISILKIAQLVIYIHKFDSNKYCGAQIGKGTYVLIWEKS